MSDPRRARAWRAAATCTAAVAVVLTFMLVVGMLPGLTMALIFGGAQALHLGIGAAAMLSLATLLVVAATAAAWHTRGHGHAR